MNLLNQKAKYHKIFFEHYWLRFFHLNCSLCRKKGAPQNDKLEIAVSQSQSNKELPQLNGIHCLQLPPNKAVHFLDSVLLDVDSSAVVYSTETVWVWKEGFHCYSRKWKPMYTRILSQSSKVFVNTVKPQVTFHETKQRF